MLGHSKAELKNKHFESFCEIGLRGVSGLRQPPLKSNGLTCKALA